MALFARLTAQDSTKIAVHRFGAALRQWAIGQITRQQIIDTFELTGTDITELDALQAAYTALPTNNTLATLTKANRLNAMEDVFLLCETGDYNEAKAKAALGF
jgi:hypothetical protein